MIRQNDCKSLSRISAAFKWPVMWGAGYGKWCTGATLTMSPSPRLCVSLCCRIYPVGRFSTSCWGFIVIARISTEQSHGENRSLWKWVHVEPDRASSRKSCRWARIFKEVSLFLLFVNRACLKTKPLCQRAHMNKCPAWDQGTFPTSQTLMQRRRESGWRFMCDEWISWE